MKKILQLHPITLKSLRQKHPWITRDVFSAKFPQNLPLLDIYDPKKRTFLGQFIHDPKHPRVVARFWSAGREDFQTLLEKRLGESLARRGALFRKRENIYLAFGEVDALPGLFIQKLKGALLIQYNCFFWENWIPQIMSYFKGRQESLKLDSYWAQKRIPGENKTPPTSLEGNHTASDEIVREGPLKFRVRLNSQYDIGLYTDMSFIRESIAPEMVRANKILNLFSYTGAFSLQGLQLQKQVTSVDLSPKYMGQLEENIEINGLDAKHHRSVVCSCQKALKNFQKEGEKFDLIICDPPSFFSDKKKKLSVLDFYKTQLSEMLHCLSEEGKLILFQNTHKKSKQSLHSYLLERKEIRVLKTYKMGEDCPISTTFPEGNYLKGILLKKLKA